jgi:CDGSH-type Zn-finger protein
MAATKRIVVTKDGPYFVYGGLPLALQTIGADAEGGSVEWVQGRSFEGKDEYHLCRCGHSKNKPYCDGSHKRVGFDGTETASRQPVLEQAQILDGPEMQLADDEGLCAFARFCDPNGRVWNQVEETDNPKVKANFIRQTGNCPAGRLIPIDKATGKPVEPKLPQSIGIIEDPVEACSGAYWVRGGVELVGADGKTYELRNRMALCRCGRSENKPFCNGSHAADPKFKDGIPTKP